VMQNGTARTVDNRGICLACAMGDKTEKPSNMRNWQLPARPQDSQRDGCHAHRDLSMQNTENNTIMIQVRRSVWMSMNDHPSHDNARPIMKSRGTDRTSSIVELVMYRTISGGRGGG
jgi:hypothetical protein